jgi:hypothetical protein
VSARESHGGEGRIRAARFPSRNRWRSSISITPAVSNATSSLIWAPWTSSPPRTMWSSWGDGNRKDTSGERDRDPRLPSRPPRPVRHHQWVDRLAAGPSRRHPASRTRPPGPLPTAGRRRSGHSGAVRGVRTSAIRCRPELRLCARFLDVIELSSQTRVMSCDLVVLTQFRVSPFSAGWRRLGKLGRKSREFEGSDRRAVWRR